MKEEMLVCTVLSESKAVLQDLADVLEASRTSGNMLPHVQHSAAVLEVRVALSDALREVKTADAEQKLAATTRLRSLIEEAKEIFSSTEALVAYVEATTN